MHLADWLERLDREARSQVCQMEPKDCAALAEAIRAAGHYSRNPFPILTPQMEAELEAFRTMTPEQRKAHMEEMDRRVAKAIDDMFQRDFPVAKGCFYCGESTCKCEAWTKGNVP